MQYQGYQNKIRRIAEKLSFVYIKRFIILPLAALAFAALFALLWFKGSLISVDVCPTVVEFGDPADYRSQALLGRTDIEYAPINSESWGYDENLPAGEYKTRVVAWSLTGKPRYSKIQTFRVLPRRLTLTLSGTELMYGNTPAYAAEGLRDGDRVEVKFTVLSQSSDDITLRINTQSAVVYDRNGNDVTKNYIIEQTAARTLSFLKRPIGLLSGSASKIFDFQSISSDEYSIVSGSLAAGDHIEVTRNDSILYVGTMLNVQMYTIKNAAGEDVTSKYDLHTSYGELTITKRTIGIATGSLTAVYDGQPKSCNEVWMTRAEDIEFFEKNALTLKVKKPTTITDVGTVPNYITPMVWSESEGLITSCFLFVPDGELGTLTVTPRPITVVTCDGQFTFDGDVHRFPDAEIDVTSSYDLAPDHVIMAKTSAASTFVDAGTYSNILDILIYNNNGEDVTENYDITRKYGQITGLKMKLDITPVYCEKYYNGTLQYPTQEIESDKLADLQKKGYLYKSTIDGSSTAPSSIVTNITDFKLYRTQMSSNDTVELRDVTAKNLELTYISGEFLVLPRPVSVKTSSYTHYYDGNPVLRTEVTLKNLIANDNSDALPAGHSYKAIDPTSHTELGKYENRFYIRIFDSDLNDVTDCYDLEYTFGNILITKIPIFISTGSIEKTYNGKPQSNSKVTMRTLEQHSELAKYLAIEVISAPRFTEVGQYENAVEVRIVDTRTSLDVTNDYELCFEYGVITINPRRITIKTASASLIYDGRPHAYPLFEFDTNNPLANGHFISGVHANSFTDVGLHTNDLSITITGGDQKNVTHNYDINYDFGNIEIVPRKLYVSTASATFTFDGNYHTFPDLFVHAGSDNLAAGHSFKILKDVTFRFCGTYENNPSIAIVDKRGNYVTGNYDLELSYGVVICEALSITLKPAKVEAYYDGMPHSPVAIEQNDALDALVALGFTYECYFRGELTEIGTAESELLYFELYYGSQKVSYCLRLERLNGEITVRENINLITLTLHSLSKQYDETPLTLSSTNVIITRCPEGVTFARLIPKLSITDAGEISVDTINADISLYFDYKLVDEAGRDVTSRYSVNVRVSAVDEDGGHGTVLRILPRELHITSASETAVYSGVPLSNPTVTITQGSLVSGHRLQTVVETVLEPPAAFNIVTAENVISSRSIFDRNGRDVTSNYRISVFYGTLTLTSK